MKLWIDISIFARWSNLTVLKLKKGFVIIGIDLRWRVVNEASDSPKSK